RPPGFTPFRIAPEIV
nr:ranakinin R [Glandirana rugosa]